MARGVPRELAEGQLNCEKSTIGGLSLCAARRHSVGMDDSRRLEVRLPAGLSNARYAAVVQAVWSVLNVAGLGEMSSLRPDDRVTDTELNDAFDEDTASYPWAQ